MRRNTLLQISVFSLILLLAMFFSFLVGKLKFPPYSLLKASYTMLQANDTEIPKEYTETPKEYTETDVVSILSIRQPQDVSERRDVLINFLWGKPEPPSTLPSFITEDIKDTLYEDIDSLQRIDKVVIEMEFGLESTVYHFIPNNPNGNIVLYHQGHRGDFYNSKKQIRQFIDNGYAVMAFAMPLLWPNNQPTIQLPRIGRLKLTKHDHMKFLAPENGHPIKYFIEPVVIALNYLEKSFDYHVIAMVGISGGGWTTTLAAAVDTRIAKSFPVAGSYPIYLRSNSPRDWGDYEQTAPELYNTVNYLELYVLGSSGNHRKQLQIINQFDRCCFAGTKWDTYKDTVTSLVHQLGAGEFDLFLDDSHQEHLISDMAMSRILNEIKTK